MFIVVAVDTKVFPVGSIGRVVQVIAIFVVDGQEMPRLFIKFSSALGTDEAVDLEGPFSVIAPWGIAFF